MNPSFGSSALDAASRLMAPFMLMFGAYVVVHGHDSPGGGFQGGVIFAACLILVRLVRGPVGGWAIAPDHAIAMACAGVGLFTGVGMLCLVFGGNFLDYAALPLALESPAIRKAGSLAIEIGVAVAVTGVLTLIFEGLASGGDENAHE